MKNCNYNEESERKLLSILINNPDKAVVSLSVVNEQCFYSIDNSSIFNAICRVVEANERVDAISVMHKLRSFGILDTTLKRYFDETAQEDVNPELFSSLVREIVDLWKIRESNKMIQRIENLIREGTSYNKIKSIINQYSHLDISGGQDSPEGMISIIDTVIKETEEAIRTGIDRIVGLKTGFPKLDRIMSIRPETYIYSSDLLWEKLVSF